MKKAILVLLGLTCLLAARVYAFDDNDFQVWNTDTEEFKVNKDLKVALEEEFRWGDNASQFYYHHYDVGIFYALNKHWSVGGGYRHVYELRKGEFKLENEPYLTATLLLKKQGFILDSRNRLEYRHFDFQDDSWRYRNKFTLKFPWKFTKIEIQPYVADEIFVGLGGGTNEFNQNRLSAGFGMNLTKNIKGEIYYLLQSTKSSDIWADANVLGTKIKIAF